MGNFSLATGFGDTPSQELPFRVFKMGTARVAVISFSQSRWLWLLLGLFLLRFVAEGLQDRGRRLPVPYVFLDPETDTYSLSNLQVYAWTVASIFGFAYCHQPRSPAMGSWPDVRPICRMILVSAGTEAIGSQMVKRQRA